LLPDHESESYSQIEELSLPPLTLLPTPIQVEAANVLSINTLPRVVMPPTSSKLFTKGLYRRELLDTRPPTIKIVCLQPGCRYSLPPQGLKQSSTGNLWRHYSIKHPTVSYALKNDNSSASSSTSSFFSPRPLAIPKQLGSNPSKYKELLLQFVVSNNLSIRLVKSYSFRELVQFLSPMTTAISARTIHRELQRQFSYHRGQLQLELNSHIIKGGRISITTDAWSARNYTDYAAITAHWINDKWQQKSRVLDVIHLQEPIHSGEYLAQQLAIVTDDMGITGAVFTCTRDNASANTVMLAEYEKIARDQEVTTQQPWTFKVKEGDVRCIAHIINIAVQDALKTLKAAPAEQAESYRCEQGAARIPTSSESNIDVKNTLGKLRRHIYVFRNRRQWKDALQRQTVAAGLKKLQLSLDMPVRWNSTYEMVSTAIKLQTPITAICATQQMDMSMRDIALTPEDWNTLHALQNFFYIFVKPSQKLQASLYPTLNFAIPQYLKMINKLEALQKEVSISSTIVLACVAAYKKLNDYYTLAANQRWSHSGVATICDPRMNLNVFNSLWPNSTEEVKRNRVKQQFHDVFIQYRDRQYYLDEEKRDAEADLLQLPTEPDSDDDLYISHSIYQEPEWKRWLVEPRPGPATDILKYWAAKQYQYPIIAAIARDHLAIPATSAPSERVFSNGADILTKKRNRLSPETLRYLLCLRDWGHIPEGDESEAENADDEREY
jgi:hypothetical protein